MRRAAGPTSTLSEPVMVPESRSLTVTVCRPGVFIWTPNRLSPEAPPMEKVTPSSRPPFQLAWASLVWNTMCPWWLPSLG